MANKIKAVRNGQTRLFTKQVWDNLPEGKMGWRVAASVPEELRPYISQEPEANYKVAEVPKPRRARKKDSE